MNIIKLITLLAAIITIITSAYNIIINGWIELSLILIILCSILCGFILKDVYLFLFKTRKKIFVTDVFEKDNEKFHAYLNHKIKSAKKEIYITGEGFGKGSEHRSQLSVNATRVALSNKVKVVRLQTTTIVEEYWKNQLRNLLNEYPNDFELFVARNDLTSSGIASICTIDAFHDRKNILEAMFSVKRQLGSNNTNLAGIGVFIEGRQQLCDDFTKRILEEIETSAYRVTLNNFDRSFSKKLYYFSYGSNMDKAQMQERCPNSQFISTGFIKNYDIVFNREGDHVEGGVASIEPAANLLVWGVVYEITESDLTRLRGEENPNKDESSYVESDMLIETEELGEIECLVFLAVPEGLVTPDKGYLDRMIKAAEKANLPENYVFRLKKWLEK